MSLNEENLIHSHNKILVELAYLALLGRLAEEAAFGCAINEIAEKGYDYYLNSVKSSEEFCLKYGGKSQAEPPVDLSALTPHACRIYADLEKAIGNKKKELRA